MKETGIALLVILAIDALASPFVAEAQPMGKVYRIGVLTFASSPDPVERQIFLNALGKLGYGLGQNLILEDRYGSGQDRLPALAAELAGLNIDVIVTYGWPAAKAAKEATRTIPIVFTIFGDPVKRGLVASFARPGGNLTGLVANPGGIYEKRLQLLKETVPGAARLAYLLDANYGPAPASTSSPEWDVLRALGCRFSSWRLRVQATSRQPSSAQRGGAPRSSSLTSPR